MSNLRVFPLVLLLCAQPAAADKIDDLARLLMSDPSYKVRVQAALVLGKLHDKRAVPALQQALGDENESVRGVAATSLGQIGDKSASQALMGASRDPSEFVRNQAKKALDLLANVATPASAPPGVRAGARYYVAVGFELKGGNAQYGQVVREALTRELQKLPSVTLSVGGGAPTTHDLQQKRLKGFVVDGSIQRLSASRQGGQNQIDCDLRAFVATYPERAIKMMTTEGASLQTGSGASDESSGKRDCLMAAVEAVRDDVNKFLQSVE
jgi:hypothetical protein